LKEKYSMKINKPKVLKLATALLLAFIALSACSSESGNEPSTAKAAPEPVEAAPLAATVLGEEVRTADAGEMQQIIITRLFDQYAVEHGIEAAEPEISSFEENQSHYESDRSCLHWRCHLPITFQKSGVQCLDAKVFTKRTGFLRVASSRSLTRKGGGRALARHSLLLRAKPRPFA
jgi:hypothetical protein